MGSNSITVVVPTFSDSRKSITRIPLQRRLWISLRNQTDRDFSVVAVDNASHDDTEGLFREYFPGGCFVRHDTPNHRAGARNTGAKVSNTSHIIFMDCDLLAYENFIENFREFIDRHPWTIGIGRAANYWRDLHLSREFIKIEEGKESIDFNAYEASVSFDWGRLGMPPAPSVRSLNYRPLMCEPNSVDFFMSTVFCISRDLYFSIGGFDESFIGWGHEDTYFGHIAKYKGEQWMTLNNVVCIHQNHRPEVPDQTHWDDCGSEQRNAILLRQKLSSIGIVI